MPRERRRRRHPDPEVRRAQDSEVACAVDRLYWQVVAVRMLLDSPGAAGDIVTAEAQRHGWAAQEAGFEEDVAWLDQVRVRCEELLELIHREMRRLLRARGSDDEA